MRAERSPCLQCERLKKDKYECAPSCKQLEMYMEKLPYCLLTGEDLTYYRMPGLERTPAHLSLD